MPGREVRIGRGGAVSLLVAGFLCQELGASLSVLLFPRAGALGMAMLRMLFAALVLLVVIRPRLSGRERRAWGSAVGLGLSLAAMNSAFYLAIERLPLGVTVTIEVLGPLLLSVAVSRRPSAWLWAALALAGVALLGGGGWDRLDPLGVLWALLAAACWAVYIPFVARTSRDFARLDGLALGMGIGATALLPGGILSAGAVLLDPGILASGAAVAVLSSLIPYSLEIMAIRRIPAGVFSVLMSLGPATASLVGFVVLGQTLSWAEAGGIALVIAASVGALRLGGTATGQRT